MVSSRNRVQLPACIAREGEGGQWIVERGGDRRPAASFGCSEQDLHLIRLRDISLLTEGMELCRRHVCRGSVVQVVRDESGALGSKSFGYDGQA